MKILITIDEKDSCEIDSASFFVNTIMDNYKEYCEDIVKEHGSVFIDLKFN